jgi:hypothetical protein
VFELHHFLAAIEQVERQRGLEPELPLKQKVSTHFVLVKQNLQRRTN